MGASLHDPVGSVVEQRVLDNGLRVSKMRAPLGLIGIIYESRPNVTSDAAGLCLKAGNAVILRGGSLAVNSNLALTKVLAPGTLAGARVFEAAFGEALTAVVVENAGAAQRALTALRESDTSGAVLAVGPEFKLLARNYLDDSSIFNATPTISNSQLLIRSDKALYCIGKE